MRATEIRTIATAGARLWARRDGDPAKPCIILVAGANASHLMWPDEFCALLIKEGFSIIRYDHRDTGKSSRCDFEKCPYALADLAEDIISVLDGFQVDQAHAVGLSMGGTLVQAAVLDHPLRFRSATVMLSAALDVDFVASIGRAYSGEPGQSGLPCPKREVLDVLAQRNRPSSSLDAELDRRVSEWIALSGDLSVAKPEEFRRWERCAIEHSGTLAQPTSHAIARPIPLSRGKELAYVTVPFLVIQGGKDPLNPPPHGEHLARLIPSARLIHLEELGHSLPGALHAKIVDAIVSHARRRP